MTTGLDSLQTSYEKHWIGWPGMCIDREEDKREISAKLGELNFHPVFLSPDHFENYYEGYSNSTIWPLCHYFFAYTQYKNRFWQAYQQVNRLFCEEVCRLVGPEDLVWVQDYQLMLLPGLLRQVHPEMGIGYFHHIPFPSYELFRILPERAEILKGLLGADFVAFHTPDYMRHFISAAERVLRVDFKLDEVQLGNRVVRVDALPMGINYELYHQSSLKSETRQAIDRTRKLFGSDKLILSVDRLDYSKGILHRLGGFAAFLEHHPEYRGRVTLAMVIVPSRDRVGCYAELKTKIDEEIGSINGRYSTMDWTPVCYFYHGFGFEELAALYYVADVALVTPLRDGMNLVAKEYVATKRDNPGVLILSEMAGAAVEMTDALLINPNDIEQIEHAICRALEMPVEEQLKRIGRMQATLSFQTVSKWASDFVRGLNEVGRKNKAFGCKRITASDMAAIKLRYDGARRRLILLDYDGTLIALKPRPEDAAPTPELLNLLELLAADSSNRVVINSGRDHLTLDRWLGKLPVWFAAEHGAFYKEDGVWHNRAGSAEWGAGLLSVLRLFVRKTPGSCLEEKETALAWHYREVDAWLGTLRAQQLVNALISICSRQNLQILQGNKVVEIKSPDYTKGSEVNRLLQSGNYDFILAMGDDTTDDDMFQVLPSWAETIKIGHVSECALYNLPSQSETLPFLRALMERKSTGEGVRGGFKSAFGFFRRFTKRVINNHPSEL